MPREYAVWAWQVGKLMKTEMVMDWEKSIVITKLNELAKEGWRVAAQSVVKGDDDVWKIIYTLERGG